MNMPRNRKKIVSNTNIKICMKIMALNIQGPLSKNAYIFQFLRELGCLFCKVWFLWKRLPSDPSCEEKARYMH